jgi:hypothetical protein
MRFRLSFENRAWLQLVFFFGIPLIALVMFVLIPGCYVRWRG